MPYIQWNQGLSVGVGRFDEDHKKLVSLVNDLHDGIIAGGARTALVTTLDELVRYTVLHFGREEELMTRYAYPELTAHRAEHDELVARVHEFREQFDEGRRSFSLELMNFLRDWLVKHIMGTDMRYREFFNGKGVV